MHQLSNHSKQTFCDCVNNDQFLAHFIKEQDQGDELATTRTCNSYTVTNGFQLEALTPNTPSNNIQTYDTFIQANPEIYVERKQSQDSGECTTINSGLIALPVELKIQSSSPSCVCHNTQECNLGIIGWQLFSFAPDQNA